MIETLVAPEALESEAEGPPEPPEKRYLVMAVSCAMSFAVGLVAASLGPSLPELAARTGSSLSDMGIIFSAIFLGSIASQLVAGPIGDRFGHRPVLFAAITLFALGIVGVLLSTVFGLTIFSTLIAGVGDGAIIIGANLLVALTFAHRSVSALSLASVFFGVGAIVGPAIAGLTLRTWNTALPSLWIGVVVLFAILPFLAVLRPGRRAAASSPERDPAATVGSVYRLPLLWGLGALLLIYVGTEAGLGGWAATYVNTTTTLGLDAAALVTSGFYVALTMGRTLVAVSHGKISSSRLLFAAFGSAFVSAALLLVGTGNTPLTVAAILLMGLSFAPVYPTMMAVGAGTFTAGKGKAISLMAALGSLGGALLPKLQGTLLGDHGATAFALLFAASTLAMLVLYSLLRFFSVRREQLTLATGAAADADH